MLGLPRRDQLHGVHIGRKTHDKMNKSTANIQFLESRAGSSSSCSAKSTKITLVLASDVAC